MNENEGKPVVIRARAVVLDSISAHFADASPGSIAIMLKGHDGPLVLTQEQFEKEGWEWAEEPRPKRNKVSTQKYEAAVAELLARVGHVSAEGLARETGATPVKAAAWLFSHGKRLGLLETQPGVWQREEPCEELEPADPQPEAKA